MTVSIASSNIAETTPDAARSDAPETIPRQRSAAADSSDLSAWGYALVEIRRDGTFGQPRLLASTAPADPAVAVRLAMAGCDWSGVAAALVESHAVPRILAGTAGDLVASAVRVAAVGAAEPVLLAAIEVARGHADAAAAALERVRVPDTDEPSGGVLARRLGASLAQLALARLTGGSADGIGYATRSRELMTHLPVALLDGLPELPPLLDAHTGSLQVSSGQLNAATRTLARGARHSADSNGHLARADCEGQLALLEAFRGDLRSAQRHAACVLADDADAGRPGVVHAHLAQAWVHLDRCELVQARQRLDQVASVLGAKHEPWLTTGQLLAETRLLTAVGQPEAAIRLLAGVLDAGPPDPGSGWLRDLLVIASAEALIAAGEPQRALAVVTPAPADAAVGATVVAALARREIGDVRGARAALATVVSDLAGAPLGLQVQAWLLESRLAQDEGNAERARLLVDRALRAAGAEELRRPLTQEWRWLHGFIDRDVSLMRDHRAFLASFRPARPPQLTSRVESAWSGQPMVETLTEREGQVLELLAQMYSTDEIAGALYVSANTVKTHLKGIFGKLCVNRRVDAVRRGRELGLC